jgi:hypothetical protein
MTHRHAWVKDPRAAQHTCLCGAFWPDRDRVLGRPWTEPATTPAPEAPPAPKENR